MTILSQRRYPLKLMWIVPKLRNLYSFEIITYNDPEAVFYIDRLIGSFRARVIYEFRTRVDDDKSLIFLSAVFDVEKFSPDEYIKKLKDNKDLILDAKYSGESMNFHYADLLFPILLDNSRAIIFDKASLNGLLNHFRINFGEEGASALLFHIGQAIGESIYSSYISPRGYSSHDIEDALDNLKPILQSLGWGIIKDVYIEDKLIKISILDYWECSLLRDSSFNKPTGQIFRGVLTKVLELLHKRRVYVKETKCLSLGDEFCVFEISSLEGTFK